MEHLRLLGRLARSARTKMVLLVLDGVGDLRGSAQPRSALDVGRLPNLDRLATASSLGRLIPVAPGVTPGSGPGHLGLFGYDPLHPQVDIGRGVLEALGLGMEVRPGELAVRGNFATADWDGNLTDRRAGRPPTSECRRLCGTLQPVVAETADLEVTVRAGEGHRFVLLLRGEDLSEEVADTDPQRLGVPPLPLKARTEAGAATAARVREVIAKMEEVLRDEPRANRVLLRGFSKLPDLPAIPDLYRLRAGAFAGYPLYRGVAAACGMDVVPCGKAFHEVVTTVASRWEDYDFFFLHLKQTDAAGEDGNLAEKVRVLEEVDAGLQQLLDLRPDVLAITGDHSTPAPMKAHSWHPVPLLLHGELAFVDDCREFTEAAAVHGHLGAFPSRHLMGLLLAHAGRLGKYGA